MSSRTRTRRAVKVPAGATTIRIPRQRGRRRSGQPFIVVLPEQRSLTRELLGSLAGVVWAHRRPLAPTAIALVALPATALLHVLVWWSGLALAPLAVGPLVWLLITQRRRPATGSVLGWRIGLVLLASLAAGWAALAAAFGPLAGPLELVWLFTLIAAQTVWFIVRRTH
ncbi:hypothetical protein AB0H82_09140 [Streptomyces sp. NPDC050732]|uniref:hypothetical protein n=1 Tax=Streptomyces sp. NPDC050732 TaxID=3154632 RepID=UPI003433344D